MLGLIGDLLVVLALLNAVMYLLQPYMVFYPVRELRSTPAAWGLPYQDVWLTAEDGTRLHGWFVPQESSRRVLLLLHGNAGNNADRGDALAIFHHLGVDVLILDYRGYGRSEGRPDEAGLYQDATAAWRYLTEARGYAAEDVIVYGHSLGGVVAAKLASQTSPGGLILESTFSSGKALAHRLLPILSRLVLPRYSFAAADYLRDVRCPVLVLHSPEDDVIPYALGEATYAAASEPKAFVQMRGDHNSGFLQSQPDYERALARFITGLGEKAAAPALTPSVPAAQNPNP